MLVLATLGLKESAWICTQNPYLYDSKLRENYFQVKKQKPINVINGIFFIKVIVTTNFPSLRSKENFISPHSPEETKIIDYWICSSWKLMQYLYTKRVALFWPIFVYNCSAVGRLENLERRAKSNERPFITKGCAPISVKIWGGG